MVNEYANSELLRLLRLELKRYEALTGKCKAALSSPAEGRIYKRKNNKGKVLEYFEYKEFIDGRIITHRRSFGREDTELYNRLAFRKYASEVYKTAQKRLQLIESILKNYENSIDYAEPAIPLASKTDRLKEILNQYKYFWNLTTDTDRSYRPDERIFAYSGRRFRSKGEVLIASRLDYFGVPYIYEPILFCDNFRYHPDFVTANLRTGKIFFWEHYGMMDSDKYLKDAAFKLAQYANNGIYLHHNLLITCEYGKDVVMDIDQVDNIIKTWLL